MEFWNTNDDVCISRISDLGFSTFEFRKIRMLFLTRARLKILGNASLKIHSAFDKYPRNPRSVSQNEPPHDKTNKTTCAPSEDSDQAWLPPSLIRVFAVLRSNAGPLTTYCAHSEDSHQTGRRSRLIWVSAGRTCHFVGFVVRRLKYPSWAL